MSLVDGSGSGPVEHALTVIRPSIRTILTRSPFVKLFRPVCGKRLSFDACPAIPRALRSRTPQVFERSHAASVMLVVSRVTEPEKATNFVAGGRDGLTVLRVPGILSAMGERRRTLLVVDDHVKLARRVASQRFPDYEHLIAGSCQEALELARRQPPDAALIDLFVGGGYTGLDVITLLRHEHDRVMAVLWTGAVLLDLATHREMQRLGVPCYAKLPDELHLVRDYFDGKSEPRVEPTLPTLEEVKAQHARAEVAYFGGVNEAARKRKVSRRTMQRRLKKQNDLVGDATCSRLA